MPIAVEEMERYVVLYCSTFTKEEVAFDIVYMSNDSEAVQRFLRDWILENGPHNIVMMDLSKEEELQIFKEWYEMK